MSTATKCRAVNPATCDDPNCPEKRHQRNSFAKWLGLDKRGFTETKLTPTSERKRKYTQLPLDGYTLPEGRRWHLSRTEKSGDSYLWVRNAETGDLGFSTKVKPQNPANVERAAQKLAGIYATIDDIGLSGRALSQKYGGSWYVDILQANVTNKVYVSFRKDGVNRTAHVPLNKVRATKLLDRIADLHA